MAAGKIKHRALKLGVTRAGGQRQVAGAAAQVHQPVKPAQIEGRDDGGRTQLAEAIHAAQKIPPRLFRAEEVLEDRRLAPEGLLPAVGAFANRRFQVSPQRVERAVGIENVTRERVGTRPSQVGLSHRRVGIERALFLEQAQGNAGVQQALERVGVGAQLLGERCGVSRAVAQTIENPQGHCGEHGFRAPKGLDEIQHRRRIGKFRHFKPR